MFIKNRKIFTISGQVIDRLTHAGVEGLRVEGWDKDCIFDDFVCSTFTMKQGIFLMTIKESYFRELFFDRRPDLYFKVYRDDELIKNTEDSGILWNLDAGETKVVIEVEMNSSSPCPELTYGVFGIVRDDEKQPVKGATVKVLDHFDELYTLLAETQSDPNGQYAVEFSADAFMKNTGAGRSSPNLVAQVFDQCGEMIGRSRQIDNAKPMTKLDIAINTTQYRVFGVVSDSAGQPLPNVTVKAFDCDMRWEEQVGKETRTSITGFFEIKYSAVQFQRAEKLRADLIVRAYDEQGKELIATGKFFNADPEKEINFSLPGGDPRGPSEFDNLVREITPLLRNVPQYDLNEKDIDFLTAETGIDRRYIEWLAESARRHVETATIDQFVFYGLFRQNLPTPLADLLGYDLPTLRDALEKSSQSHIIRYLPSNELDAIMVKLGALQADHATLPGGTGEPSSLGDLLRTVLSDAEKIRAVAQLYIAHKNRVSDEFFAELNALKLLNNQELIDTRLALQLGELTGIYLPLVRELQYMAKFDQKYAPTGDLSPYVRLSLNDWKDVLHRNQSNGEIIGAPDTVPGSDMEEKIANYALSLSQQLESAFPATTIVRRIEADTAADSPFKESRTDLMTFFDNNPSFDLTAQPLDIYLSTDADKKLSGIYNKELFTTTIKGMQLTSKLTNNDFSGMRVLMGENLFSGRAVAAVGEIPFIERFSSKLGGEEKAQGIYRIAQHVQNTAMVVYMKHAPAFQSPLPYVIGGRPRTVQGKLVEENKLLPDWTKLFGSLEMCECRHCRSLYSPGAYLVDTLNFIHNTAKKCNDKNALENLLLRRPDIEHIELTCENANTPMPYVDLVNEILEANVKSREFFFEDPTGSILTRLIERSIDAKLFSEFANRDYSLTDKASVRVIVPGLKWTIVDSSWVFVLTRQATGVIGFNVSAWPQTSWTTKELKANPEHTHNEAYDKLRTAVYPWDLPFNLPIVEARVYLQHLGVHRHEVLSVFMRGDSPDPDSDSLIAYEYLGLTPEEAQIINGTTTSDPTSAEPGLWNFWGLSRNDWIEALKQVSIFLNRSSLSYRELLNLLTTFYFNPRSGDFVPDWSYERSIIIVSSDKEDPFTCNPDKLALKSAWVDPRNVEAMFSRAHRFTRLARKLGWPLRDLDKAFMALNPMNKEGVPDITDAFLIQLSHIQRLFVEKNIPVVNLLSLWANIDNTSYVDHIADGEPEIPSLYARMFLSKTTESAVFQTLDGQKISEHTAAIAAAFGIGADDVDRLRADPWVIEDDNLTLDNLSRLYRHSLLARIVELPIRQYLVTLRLIAEDPFTPIPVPGQSTVKLNTATTLDFINNVKRITGSGFSVDDLDYLLCHSPDSTSGLVITDADIGAALDVIRTDLRQIASENTFIEENVKEEIPTTDPKGEHTRNKLVLLNWGAAEIDRVIAVLNDTYLFEAELSSLDKSIKFPKNLADRISYDASTEPKRLRFKGVMSSSEMTQLLTPPNNNDPLFSKAVEDLHKAPRTLINRQMRRFSVPIFQSEAFDLPPDVSIPSTLKNKVFYDKATRKLNCIGVMTEVEKSMLEKLHVPLDPLEPNPYADAITLLYNEPLSSPVNDKDLFFLADEVDTMFDGSSPAQRIAQRFARVLKKLMNYLGPMLSQRMVKQRLVEHTGLDASTVDGLLNAWVYEPGTTGSSRPLAMSVFVNAEFVGSNSELPVTPTAFPQQFSTYRLLHKIAATIGKFTLSAELVRAVFEHGADRKWLNLNLLPLVKAEDAYSLFPDWSRLADLAQLRNTLPRGRAAINDWLSAAYKTDAKPEDIVTALSQTTQWSFTDLNRLKESTGFNLTNLDALRSEANLRRLADAMVMLKRLRASAEQCLAWTEEKPDKDFTIDFTIVRDRKQAQDVKSLVRAKYEPAQWLEVAGTLRDPLREKQRAALVSYLVAHPYVVVHPDSTTGQTWNDVNGLYEYFLIDVEMSPCMLTTRIKQAISSVQLYIQRTLMNLEECAVLNEDQGKQWRTWRKQYRIWEANRKVLLYPENWIEPELRDNKTPFFKDLENELLQNDITKDSAESAFRQYLDKLSEVARLEIVGLYLEINASVEKSDNEEANVETNEKADILHVIGRTFSSPHIYYYRRRIGLSSWTPWEKVEADIQGDHLIPLIWNRRFYLFWPVFTKKQKAQPFVMQEAGKELPAGQKYLEIQLAWTEYKNGRWSPKKLSISLSNELKHPDEPLGASEFSRFVFTSRIVQSPSGDQSLFIDCYGPVEITEDAPIIGSKSKLLFRLMKDKSLLIQAKVNGNLIPKSNIDKLEIIGIDNSGDVVSRTRFNPTGLLEITNSTTSIVSYFLVSSVYKVQNINPKSTQNCDDVNSSDASNNSENDEKLSAGNTNGTGCYTKTRYEIALMPLTPQTAQISINENHPIGLFKFDDSQEVVIPISTSNGMSTLTPIDGTQFKDMMMVEYMNNTDGLGRNMVLGKTPGTFRLRSPTQPYSSQWSLPSIFFFQDDMRVLYAYYIAESNKFRFVAFYHPFVRKFLTSLNRTGIDGLLTLSNQQLIDKLVTFDQYQPDNTKIDSGSSFQRENVDFSNDGAYSLYNWELFFHVPFLIAKQLSTNQRFEEAQQWFHYIFDPTLTIPVDPKSEKTPGSEKFWKVLPFFNEALGKVKTLEQLLEDNTELEKQVAEAAAKPFNPHAIARMRIVAYMKTVVMHYIENLFAWGDQLFARDTIESINEATQLYILAAEILGKRPENIPPRVTAKVQTYSTLYASDEPNSLSNASVEVEGYIFPSAAPVNTGLTSPEFAMIPYFCASPNDKLLGYWDLVADRLFKIRHCMNLAGVERTLPIYEPPIDPALLVKAAAAGIDLSSALSDINAATPHYRFGVMLQKATELCNDVKALGSALLSALEKRDVEALALLRSSHEIDVLKSVRQVREQQILEAKRGREALDKSNELTTLRRDYYRDIEYMNPWEDTQMNLAGIGLGLQAFEVATLALAGGLHLIPNFKIAAPTAAGSTQGGDNAGNSAENFSASIGKVVSLLNSSAAMAATIGGHERRFEDWKLQERLANKELDQINKQIAAADIRKVIAEKELVNHDLQIENTQEVNDFMRDKFTNQELYNWMVRQLSAIYFQSYQLAYEVAKRAERAYRFELGLQDSNFIQFGYWDSLKKGLLAGERLHYDLKRMDVAYLDQNRREHEITKHISLAALDPMALTKLKEVQSCFISLPEVLFDLDHAGHYLRRIKTVSVTIPCVTGPYSGVHCTLTLLNSSIRHSNMLLSDKYERHQPDDIRFTDNIGAIQSIVTSSGQNDSGLFETNLRDERYLPFEGAGVISEWRLQLPENFHQFDYETISDVVLHLRYTARDGGQRLAEGASKAIIINQLNALRQLAENQNGLIQMLSLRNEYPTEWNQLRSGAESKTVIILNKMRFPSIVSKESINLIHFAALARVHETKPAPGQTLPVLGEFTLKLMKKDADSKPTANLGFSAESNLGDWRVSDQVGMTPTEVTKLDDDTKWELELLEDSKSVDAKQWLLLEDIVLLVGYNISTASKDTNI